MKLDGCKIDCIWVYPKKIGHGHAMVLFALFKGAKKKMISKMRIREKKYTT